MPKTDRYLQFPLCALSCGQTVDDRLNACLDYAVVDAGTKLWRKATPEVQSRFLSQLGQGRKLPTGFKRDNRLHVAALCGTEMLNVKYPDMNCLLERYQRFKAFLALFESQYGRDALVRIKREWLFKVRDHRGMSYRELAVLCAIYCCIGSKKVARVTQPRIRRCALGYRTAAIMQAEIARRADGAKPLTVRELRDTIDRLHRNKFFARCTYGNRFTYYSIRLNNEELRKHVEDKHSYPSIHRAMRKAQDDALTEAVRHRRAAVGPPSGPTR
jgi:hypothetical protein